MELLLEEEVLSIEHIMPQTLTPQWKKDLGENYEEIHDTYLHSLPNLTLTGYNSEYSNKPFGEKKSMKGGFDESPLYLNNFLKTIDKWGEEEILQRYEILKDKALKIWLYPKTDYVVKKDDTKIFTLSEEEVFTGEKIIEFTFEDKTHDVNSWATFYEEMVKMLFDKDPILMKTLVNDEYLSTKFFNSEPKGFYSAKIGEGFYLKMGLNTQRILHSLRQVFDKYEISLDDLTFYIK